MRVVLASVGAALLLALVVSQLLLPRYLEHRVEDRLTAGGGSADVTIEALPALRLLVEDGDRLAIEGHDLRVDLRNGLKPHTLDGLDGFDEVSLRLRTVRAAPFDVRTFELTRPEGADDYRLVMDATTSAGDLVAYGAAGLPLLGPLLSGAAGAATQDARIPLDVNAVLRSDDGRPRVASARATVAGLPVGPLVELLAGAVLSRV